MWSFRSATSSCSPWGMASMVRTLLLECIEPSPDLRTTVTQGGDWGNHVRVYIFCSCPSLADPACIDHAHDSRPIRRHLPARRALQLPHVRPLSLPVLHLTQPARRGWPINPLKSPLYYLQDQLGMGMTAARAARTQWFAAEGSGYLKQQATRPQTLGYALSDSPAGLLAWVLEKLTEWTDGYPWADDEVLDWVSVYWFSRAGPAASLHIYYERAHNLPARFAEYVSVPYGVSLFAQELQRPSMPYVHALHLFRARRPLRASRPFAPSALCSVHALLPVPALLLPHAPPPPRAPPLPRALPFPRALS
jgi:hypothetical protein